MKKIATIGDIKENVQGLETSILQAMNANPAERIRQALQESLDHLRRCEELCDAPLRIALVGEFNSGKTLLLNAMLDCADLFPSLLQPTTGNVLELRVALRREDKPVQIRSTKVSFFQERETWEILNYYLRDLNNQGLGSKIPSSVSSPAELAKLEDKLISAYDLAQEISTKYSVLATLEYVMSLKYNQSLVLRDQRHETAIPKELLPDALTLAGRPELEKGAKFFHTSLQALHDSVGSYNPNDPITHKNVRAIFPLMRRVSVTVDAWCVPFGIESPEDYSPLAFLDFPGLGAESSNARDRFLCTNEIRDAHAILLIFNGSNPGTSGASVMASLFQQVGKLTTERTMITINRFDEFVPGPADISVQDYYSHIEDGTTVGFCNLLTPAKNLFTGSKALRVYLCSALCYLYEAKADRPNGYFGKPEWFSDNKRQTAYSLYKRTSNEFKKLIREVDKDKRLAGDFQLMKIAIERYLEMGGLAALREDLIAFAREKGERLIREDALKELRAAYRLLDSIAPKGTGGATPAVKVSSEISFQAQEFYRILELAVADALPNGQSEYKSLKIKQEEKDIPIWDIIEKEIASRVASWPEWFAILNQGVIKKTQPTTPAKAAQPQKTFSRYNKIRRVGAEVPTEFKAFNERFMNTAETLSQFALDHIGQAVLYSVQRFEVHPDYTGACQSLQSVLNVERVSQVEEGLPLIDSWQPSRMAADTLVPEILDRITPELDDLKNIRYPYDTEKPCFWNLALIVRIQVQLIKTLRDRVSRLIAAAENQFQMFFVNEVLRAEVLPLVRSCLNNPTFLVSVARGDLPVNDESAWESAGQMLRGSVEEVKQADTSLGVGMAAAMAPNIHTTTEEDEEETPMKAVAMKASAPAAGAKPATPGAAGAKPATPGTTPGAAGAKPATPGTTPGAAGAKPATPGAKPATPGTTPGAAGAKPATPGAKPATPGAVRPSSPIAAAPKSTPASKPTEEPTASGSEPGEPKEGGAGFEEW